MSIFDQLKSKLGEGIHNQQDELWEKEMLEKLLQLVKKSVQDYPGDEEYLDEFLDDLKEKIREHDWKQYHYREGNQPENARAHVYVVKNRMAAFLCVLSPIGKGREVTVEDIRRELRYKSVAHGLDEELLGDICQEKRYGELIAISRGIPATESTQGEVAECVPRMPPLSLTPRKDHTVDFSDDFPIAMVGKGDVICQITPNQPGVDGTDVSGRKIPAKKLEELYIPAGRQVSLSPDGKSLVADVAGHVYYENKRFSVEPAGRLDFTESQPSRRTDWDGNLVILGDIPAHASLHVGGNLVVTGKMGAAQVTVDGAARIQHGIWGGEHGGGKLVVGGNLLAVGLRQAQVEIGGNIYTDSAEDSAISCGGIIYVLGGEGRMAGVSAKADRGIEALYICSSPSRMSSLLVGYSEQEIQKMDELSAQLKETDEILDKIRKSLSAFRGIQHMPEEKREIMDKLSGQKRAYGERQQQLLGKLRQLKKKDRMAKGSYVKGGSIAQGTEIASGKYLLTAEVEIKKSKVFLYGDEWKVEPYA